MLTYLNTSILIGTTNLAKRISLVQQLSFLVDYYILRADGTPWGL